MNYNVHVYHIQNNITFSSEYQDQLHMYMYICSPIPTLRLSTILSFPLALVSHVNIALHASSCYGHLRRLAVS